MNDLGSRYFVYQFLLKLPLLAFLLAQLHSSTALAQTDADDMLIIDSVSYIELDTRELPRLNDSWQTLQLPLGSRIGDPNESGRVIWMRFELSSPNSEDLMALYFYRYNLSIDVYVNGSRVGGDSFRTGRQTVSWNHPLLVPIQSANWLSEENEVLVRLQTSYFGGTFAPILFGKAEQLQLSFEQRHFRQVTINQWILYGGLISLVLSLILWAFRPQDKTYLIFAGMAACWIVLVTHMVIYYNPVPYRYWLPFVHISADIWGTFLFIFVSRITEISRPLAERSMIGWCCIATGWNLFAPMEYWWIGAYVMHALGNSIIGYLLICVVRNAITAHNRLAIAISLTICAQLVLFGNDLALVFFADAEDWEGALYLSQFAFPLLMLVFAGTLLNRFVSALAIAENLNLELEERVEAGKRTIEKSFAEKRELELKQAAVKERMQIYRDLHDDVGSKLLSIVHASSTTVDGPRISDLARSALASLRSAVSRANSPEQPLLSCLNDLEEESRLRLEGSGHNCRWNQSPDLSNNKLSSEQVFNLTQIIREIVSNIIRHAQASAVVFNITSHNSELVLTIEDNGNGFDGMPIQGNGLSNIRNRVDELGGTATWSRLDSEGLLVTLQIPMT